MQSILESSVRNTERSGRRAQRSIASSLHARGVTLIEMMVAVLVLSIGLLGMAGLQAATSKYKINTWARSASSTLLSELTEKVRINSNMAGQGFIDPLTKVSSYLITDSWATQQSAALTVSKNCETTACSESERAIYDITVWRQKVRALLPQGAAMISGDKSAGMQLTLMWLDKEQATAASDSDPLARTMQKAPLCSGSETGMAQQSCCPTQAAAPAGVRCARFSFVP